jgi:NAD(P)-dependent dehydrogenase (short-subunit alcohol dehydrogenase family)
VYSVKVKDRVAIVTGAAQGIGRAIALGLAREGAQVVIADLQEDKAIETADEIRGMGRKSLALKVDVSDLSDLSLLVQTTLREFGTIDILINNAGIALPTPFLETTEEAWDRIVDVNLKSAFFCSQYVARIMVERQRGRIVNLASTSSFVAGRQEVPYAISKAGVRMLTASAAAELAPYNVNVNAIAPGLIKTPLTEKHFPSPEALEARVQAKTPMGRAGTPEDLVGAVIFLCSDEAEYVTGHTLVVDGGWLTQ